MSTFGEFGPLSERRKADLQQRRRKRVMMAGGAVSLIIILAAVAAVVVFFVTKGGDDDNKKTTSSNNHNKKGSTPPKPPTITSVDGTSTKLIETICTHTDHKPACLSSLKKSTNSTMKPKDYIKAAVSVVYDAVGEAFNKSSMHKSDDPIMQGAVEVCDRMLVDSELDLKETMAKIEISKLEDLPKASPVLNIWLSAVRAYQETCVDAFPIGEAKDKMKDAMKHVNELTSNALAIVSKVAKFMSALDATAVNRRLLSAEEKSMASVDEEGYPSWIEDEDRRVLKQNPAATLTPNVIVAKDGSGRFTTINDALNAMPAERPLNERYVIYVKEGIYDEQVTVMKKMINVTMYGDGNVKTIVTGNKNFALAKIQTYLTATFAVEGNGFMCLNMGFHNTAGPEGEQAVALRVKADCTVFLNCHMIGYQDTLYAHAKRQFYRNCDIAGTIDYVFGDAAAIFQNCVLIVRRPGPGQSNIVTAQGRAEPLEQTGFVMHNCKVNAGEDLVPVQAEVRSYLARPWKAYSRTIFMETEIQAFIDPAGYLPWGDTAVGQDTCTYAEYMNTGPGADTAARAKWKGVQPSLTKTEATQYLASAFVEDIAGWSKSYGVPVPLRLSFFQP